MARKRKPGGGRKPKGDYPDMRASLTIRIPTSMKAELEAAAAASGKTLTHKILSRLTFAANAERARSRDPASQALCFLLAETIDVVRGNTVAGWRDDPFAFQAVRKAFDQILAALQPPGEAKPHEADPLDPGGPKTRNAFFIFTDSPDEMAKTAAAYVLFGLQRDDGGEVNASPRREIEYDMARARRDLKPQPNGDDQ